MLDKRPHMFNLVKIHLSAYAGIMVRYPEVDKSSSNVDWILNKFNTDRHKLLMGKVHCLIYQFRISDCYHPTTIFNMTLSVVEGFGCQRDFLF